MQNKDCIIFIPAWWPCSFFEEQQSAFVDKYDLYNLFGSCKWLSKKSIVKQLFSDGKLNLVDSHISGMQINVRLRCPKSMIFGLATCSISKISEIIGELILSVTKGRTPKFIYLQSISDVAIFVAEWAKKKGINIILTEHILYIRRDTDYITQRKELLYTLADKVFCVSNYQYRNLLTNGFRINEVSIIGNLVNEYAIPSNWNHIHKNGKIMFVATHTADKDMPTLFKVAKLIQESSYMIDIYGLTGAEKLNGKALRDYASKNITFMGIKSHKEVLERYSAYSLLLSTSCSETFGLSVAEAISHGTPVVCTDSGGVRDFVEATNGIIVGIADVYAIAAAIHEVISCKYDYKIMSKRILDKYGMTAYMNNFRFMLNG